MFPSHPLFRRFENELDLGEQWLEWTTRGADLLARPLGADLDVVWCWPTDRVTTLCRGEATAAQVVIEKDSGYRFYALNAQDSLLLGQTHGFLRSHQSHLLLRFAVPRRFWGGGEVLEMATSKLKMRVEVLMTHDELNLVQGLLELLPSPWQWIEWQRGSLDEFIPLVNALFVLVGTGEFSFTPNQNNEVLQLDKVLKINGSGSSEQQELFADLLSQSFGARANAHIKRLYIHPQKATFGRACRIKSAEDESSAHERLEALLLWREFLRDKVSPERSAEILALLKEPAS